MRDIRLVIQSKSRSWWRWRGCYKERVSELELVDDGLGELLRRRLAARVSRQGLALGKRGKGGLLDPVGILAEIHVPEHHHGAEEEGGGVGQALAGDVGSG